MKKVITKYSLSDLCQIVGVKSYILPLSRDGRPKGTLYVPQKFVINEPFAAFVREQKDRGFYLLSDSNPNLLYCSFVLNSGVGMMFMHDEQDQSYTNGTVSKKKLEKITINTVAENYKWACTILELMIIRISNLEVKDDAAIVRDVTGSFLRDMRSYIGLEIYMNKIFENHQVSVLEPWTKFVEEKGGSYRLKQVDDVFISFYKTISDPENDIMDAMKKARLLVWELSESIKKG